MFRSKIRNLIFPQQEHLRLTGAFVLYWGNDNFDQPALNFDSFQMGVALHDWGHGFLDQNEIGAMDAEERLRSMANLVQAQLPDTTAELVMQHHVLRLMGDEPMYDQLRHQLKHRISENIRQVNLDEQDNLDEEIFLRADRITNLADMISFDFCFGEPLSRTIPVYAHLGDETQTDITYSVADGVIQLNPWPLQVDSLNGYMLAYEADGYPIDLKPHVVAYKITN
ncbi:MAG: DUF3891 family protein [Chloroflexota bacterium]